jgi:hypothetical protein
VELQNFLNDVVTYSPHLGGVKSTAGPSTSRGGGQPTRMRNVEDPLVGDSMIWKRNYGSCRGRGRGGGQGGRSLPSQNTGRINFSAIATTNALTSEERKRHIEEGLSFKCHKKGHRLFQCPNLKGKATIGAPSQKQ